ncbi:MAG: hypothetical protein ABF326_00195 [Arenicellales bacterium]|jgi:hypothetical protein
MPNLKLQFAGLVLFLSPAVLFFSVSAHAISKCQDADGKWHYGDNAASICGDARITIIDDRGRKIDEIPPPMTVEEFNALEAEEKRKAAEERENAKRELEKRRILAIYPREESIIRARDERLKGMDNNIRVQEALLDDMRLDMKVLESKKMPEDPKARAKRESQINSQQASIDAYYQAITRLRREREQTSEKYERILREFRELTAE